MASKTKRDDRGVEGELQLVHRSSEGGWMESEDSLYIVKLAPHSETEVRLSIYSSSSGQLP